MGQDRDVFEDEPRSKRSAFVEIGNREIYDTLTQLVTKVNSLEQSVDASLKASDSIKKEYGQRLRSLELRSYTVLAGCISMVAILIKSGGIAGL